MDEYSMTRILVDESELDDAIQALDENYIDNDLDGDDRIMVPEAYEGEALSILDELGINYDII